MGIRVYMHVWVFVYTCMHAYSLHVHAHVCDLLHKPSLLPGLMFTLESGHVSHGKWQWHPPAVASFARKQACGVNVCVYNGHVWRAIMCSTALSKSKHFLNSLVRIAWHTPMVIIGNGERVVERHLRGCGGSDHVCAFCAPLLVKNMQLSSHLGVVFQFKNTCMSCFLNLMVHFKE